MRIARLDISVAAWVTLAVLVFCAGSEARQYRAEPLGSLGGGYGRARAMSSTGYAVGEALIPVQGTVEHAFRWYDGVMLDLGTLGGGRSRALDVNVAGCAPGWAQNAAGATRPVYWDSYGSIHELPTLGGRAGTAWAINDYGTMAGNAYISDSVYRAAVWQDGAATYLGTLGGNYSIAYDVNDGGVVAGGADDSMGKQRACIWRGADLIDIGRLSGGVWDTARGVNSNGQVILWGRPAGAANNRAALWSGIEGDPVIDLGTFGGVESWAYGLNDLGWVVGSAEDSTGIYRAFVYDGASKTDLGTLGGLFSNAYGVTNDGIVVGYAQNSQGAWQACRWVPVPEPCSAASLAGLILIALTGALRRRGV